MSSFFCESTDMVAAGSLDDGVYSSQVYHRSQSRNADRGKSADVVSVGTKPRPVGKPESRLEDACTNAVPDVLDAATVIPILSTTSLAHELLHVHQEHVTRWNPNKNLSEPSGGHNLTHRVDTCAFTPEDEDRVSVTHELDSA